MTTKPLRDNSQFAAGFVAKALANTRPDQRHEVLSQLMAHAANGLVIVSGERAACQEIYRLADAVATRQVA